MMPINSNIVPGEMDILCGELTHQLVCNLCFLDWHQRFNVRFIYLLLCCGCDQISSSHHSLVPTLNTAGKNKDCLQAKGSKFFRGVIDLYVERYTQAASKFDKSKYCLD